MLLCWSYPYTTQLCEEEVQDPGESSQFDYPPRVFFTATQTRYAQSCKMELDVLGLNKDVNFNIRLTVAEVNGSEREQS